MVGQVHEELAGLAAHEDALAVVLRRGGAAGSANTYTLRLAEDVYPNQPNVRRYTVDLDAGLFAGPHFAVQDIGPFVLAVRKPST